MLNYSTQERMIIFQLKTVHFLVQFTVHKNSAIIPHRMYFIIQNSMPFRNTYDNSFDDMTLITIDKRASFEVQV